MFQALLAFLPPLLPPLLQPPASTPCFNPLLQFPASTPCWYDYMAVGPTVTALPPHSLRFLTSAHLLL